MNSSTIAVGRQQTTISNQTIQKWRRKNCEIFDIFLIPLDQVEYLIRDQRSKTNLLLLL